MAEDAPDASAPPGIPGPKVLAVFAAVFVLVLCTTLLSAVMIPKTVERRLAADRAACANQLRGVGLAAIQYAQDQGSFPHVQAADVLDGDPSTADTPRAWRMLVTGGYLDRPEDLLCPAAPKFTTTTAQRGAQRRWLTDPADTLPGPALAQAEELSYGWTRRALSANARPDTMLAADKAVFARRGPKGAMRGNHTQGWAVVRADSSTEWLSVHDEPFPGPRLWSTRDPETDGFLCVQVQEDPSLLR